MANDIIVKRFPDSDSAPNFDIFRMPNSGEIMIVLHTEKRGRYMCLLEDTQTAKILALKLLQFLALEN